MIGAEHSAAQPFGDLKLGAFSFPITRPVGGVAT
jgi:hypothetical protein